MKRFFLLLLLGALVLGVLGCSRNGDGVQTESAVPTSVIATPYFMDIADLPEQAGVYSAYYFAPSDGALQISGTLQESGDGGACQISILLFQVGIEDNIDRCTVDFQESGTVAYAFTGLDPDAHYFLRVDNQSDGGQVSGRLTIG